MQGTETIARKYILENLQGRIITASDLSHIDEPANIRKALSTMTAYGFLTRIARGHYIKPVTAADNPYKSFIPSTDSIAQQIAEISGIRIIPNGELSAYIVGFTNLRLNHNTYLTDGAPRTIHLNSRQTIRFEHTSEMRIFKFRDTSFRNLSLALRYIGKENIGNKEKSVTANTLTNVPKQDFFHDIKLCPVWIQELIYTL